MKLPTLKALVATSLAVSSFCLSAAPLSILESVACGGDASGYPTSACFILPSVSSFVVQGDLTPEGSSNFDLSDFLTVSGLLAGVGYDFGFSQSGTSAFGIFFDADSILGAFDSSAPTGSVFADSGGNIFAGIFLEDDATNAATYALALNAVPAPATVALLGMGLLLGRLSLQKKRTAKFAHLAG
jgi:hypothetical protein